MNNLKYNPNGRTWKLKEGYTDIGGIGWFSEEAKKAYGSHHAQKHSSEEFDNSTEECQQVVALCRQKVPTLIPNPL